MFQPPPPVTTVDDLLRYPTEKLVELEQTLPIQSLLRPIVVEALRRRAIMQRPWIDRVIFSIDSDCGQIGPFWWINARCDAHQITGLYGLSHDLSEHIVWRQGGCGFVFGARYFHIARLKWHILEALN